MQRTVSVFILYIFLRLFDTSSAYLVDDNPYHHFVTFDQNTTYQLKWLVDWNQKRVVFNVTVKTTGYVGFGLIRRAGETTGADIIIGGVFPNGRSYFSDRHASGNQLPEVDISQDWKLHSAWEGNGQTFLSFSRPFDTCDQDHDLPITDNTITLVWAFGEIDDHIQYHFENRGTYDAYLLDPDLTPRMVDPSSRNAPGVGNMDIFTMSTEIIIPLQDTTYWCTFHRMPITTKHHIIGFNTVFRNDQDRNYIHRLLLYRCRAPDGIDPVSLFEGVVKSEGSECYFLAQPNPLPTQYCRETIHVWAVGGRAIFFPAHAGLPVSESGSEYFVMQVHYDNPNMIPNLNVSVDLEAYYAENLRQHDVGMLQLGEYIPGSTSIIIPPSSLDHVIMGHCAPGCMESIIPDEGVNVFASFLQTHSSGRAVRFLHHRGNQELPWISYDDNYNFKYQQFRVLRQERRLFPGDHLMDQCLYDTTNRNGSIVGGFSTREEMCTAFLYYYPRSQGFVSCRSEIRTEAYWNLLGIQNTTWDQSRRQTVITSPPQYFGHSVFQHVNNNIDWSIETREALQRHHRFDPQVSQCPHVGISPNKTSTLNLTQLYLLNGNTRFPKKVVRYIPLNWSKIQMGVNDDPEYLSVNPRGISRYRRPALCFSDAKSQNSGNSKS